MKRKVQEFKVEVIGTDVHVYIITDRKKPHNYRIWKDERHPDIFAVAQHLNAGLEEAKRLHANIEISEYFERMYVFIELPVPYHSNQYSAAEL